MELLAKLQEDMKTALKAGQKDRLQVIRMLISEVKIIDLQPSKPTAEQAAESYAKKLRKSIEEYQKIGRSVEVAKIQQELAVVEEYLPKKANLGDTEALVDAFLAGKSFNEKQLGQAMGAFMKAHGQQVDPAVANQLLKARLTGK